MDMHARALALASVAVIAQALPASAQTLCYDYGYYAPGCYGYTYAPPYGHAYPPRPYYGYISPYVVGRNFAYAGWYQPYRARYYW